MTRQLLWRQAAFALLVIASLNAARGSSVAARQDATPSTYSCDNLATPMAGMSTPAATNDHGGMEMGTPAAMVEFDQMYIDMMIPHHASIMAMAEAALPRLQDERLRQIAEAIIAAQGPEIDELRGYREQFYGSAEPAPMDAGMMGMMAQMMPGMAMSMDEMMAMMDPAKEVATFCAAADPDLAFIDLTIPHHQSAIAASEAALQ
jgi:uncharacterized protein (DUF305 family)